MGPSSSLLISFLFFVFRFAILIHFSQFFEPCQFFSVFACLLNGETLIFEKQIKKIGFWTTVVVDFALFWIFCVFSIQFPFFVRSISGYNYVRYIVQQKVWSAYFQREP